MTQDGIPSESWETFTYGACQTLGVYRIWSDIAYAADKANQTELSQQAKKVGFSLIAASLRLRDISDAYHYQLVYALGRGIKPDMRFTNVDLFNLFLALHSFLAEICSVRDFLAGFASRHIFLHQLPNDSMGKLFKRLKAEPSNLPLAAKILEICDPEKPSGWMAQLGQHRDNVIHGSPIQQRHDNDFVSYKLKNIENTSLNIQLPHLTYMINKNPYDHPPGSPKMDALVLFHQLYLGMAQFAELIAKLSPIKPERRVVTPIGDIQVRKATII